MKTSLCGEKETSLSRDFTASNTDDVAYEGRWTPAALERAGSMLKALNRMAKRPPIHILFEELRYTIKIQKGKYKLKNFFLNYLFKKINIMALVCLHVFEIGIFVKNIPTCLKHCTTMIITKKNYVKGQDPSENTKMHYTGQHYLQKNVISCIVIKYTLK